ncbi:hypothetical protein S83_035060 [Arachis hypogaea]
MHLVCQSSDSEENITLLFDLLVVACLDSIEDVNMRNETAGCPALMNITRVSPWPFDVINRNLKAFQELLGWLKRNTRKGAYCLEHSILNWKDLAGNTILHVAALNDNNQEVQASAKEAAETVVLVTDEEGVELPILYLVKGVNEPKLF